MPLVTLLLVVVAVEIVVLLELVVPTMDLLLFQVVHMVEQVMELGKVIQIHMDLLQQVAKDQDLVAVAADLIQGHSVVDKVVQVLLYFGIKSDKLIQDLQKQLVVPLVTIIIRPFMSSTTLAPLQHLLH
tara:strand:+ start:842 stop:1228 length:387 start_codon:yes stop_codon:yes gene_type:complete